MSEHQFQIGDVVTKNMVKNLQQLSELLGETL